MSSTNRGGAHDDAELEARFAQLNLATQDVPAMNEDELLRWKMDKLRPKRDVGAVSDADLLQRYAQLHGGQPPPGVRGPSVTKIRSQAQESEENQVAALLAAAADSARLGAADNVNASDSWGSAAADRLLQELGSGGAGDDDDNSPPIKQSDVDRIIKQSLASAKQVQQEARAAAQQYAALFADDELSDADADAAADAHAAAKKDVAGAQPTTDGIGDIADDDEDVRQIVAAALDAARFEDV